MTRRCGEAIGMLLVVSQSAFNFGPYRIPLFRGKHSRASTNFPEDFERQPKDIA